MGSTVSLRDKIAGSILNMGAQRILDLVAMLIVTTVVVRSLRREEYGMLSLVMSYGLVFNLLNVGVSAILVRDFPKLRDRINEYMNAFLLFSAIKSVSTLLLTLCIGFFLYRRYGDSAMIAVLAMSSLNVVIMYVAEPFTTLMSVDFRQGVLTRINFATGVTNVVLSLGVLLTPTALYVSIKNVLVSFVGLLLAAGYARRKFQLRYDFDLRAGVLLVRECLLGFSLWSHMIGILTDIIYRADLLILGWLNAPFRIVGNYNIALQMSNFTKLLPQILQYNATLGLSHSDHPRQSDEITFFFIKYSFLLSLVTMGAYVLFGRFAIGIIAGTGVEEIYRLGLYIIAGLCLYNTFRPLISYGIVLHDIRDCFWYAILPASAGTLVAYVVMGMFYGAEGLAKANLLGGLLMVATTLFYVHWKTDFRWHFELLHHSEKELIRKMFKRGGQ